MQNELGAVADVTRAEKLLVTTFGPWPGKKYGGVCKQRWGGGCVCTCVVSSLTFRSTHSPSWVSGGLCLCSTLCFIYKTCIYKVLGGDYIVMYTGVCIH